MNNFTKLFGTRGRSFRVILSAVLVTLAFIACGNSTSSTTSDPVVVAVLLEPPAVNIALDNIKPVQFYATVAGTGSPSQDVTWRIDEYNKDSSTTITDEGLLTVAAKEKLTSLTVRATSTADATRYGRAFVYIYQNQSQFPVVSSVTINPKTTSVPRGASKVFTATVTGTNVTQDVIWTIVQSTSVSTISDQGELVVSSAETNSTLTVKAAAANDPAKYDVATVTITTSGSQNPGGSTSADLNATWRGNLDFGSGFGDNVPCELDMNIGNIEIYQGSGSTRSGMFRGSYMTSGATLTVNITEINGNFLAGMIGNSGPDFGFTDKFYTLDEVESTVKTALRGIYGGSGMSDEQIDTAIEQQWAAGFSGFADMMKPQTMTYSLNSARTKLTLIDDKGDLLGELDKVTSSGENPDEGPGDDPVVVVPGGDTGLNGTWRGTMGTINGVNYDGDIVLSNNVDLEMYTVSGSTRGRMMKGTFEAGANELTLTPTHIHGTFVNTIVAKQIPGVSVSAQYYTSSELNSAMKDALRVYYTAYYDGLLTGQQLENAVNGMVESMMRGFDFSTLLVPQVWEYEVSATELILMDETGDRTYTRQGSSAGAVS